MSLGPIAFAYPWLLIALLALPILWLLLRAVPPAPVKRLFPAVTLLLGLKDEDNVSDRTPWWLLLLRMLAVAAIILGLAGPVLNPDEQGAASDAPLLVMLDDGWPSAPDWAERTKLIDTLLATAGRDGRAVAILRAATPEAPVFLAAAAWRAQLAGIEPQPWAPTAGMAAQLAADIDAGDDAFETVWLSDGLEREGREVLLAALEEHGPVSVVESRQGRFALEPAGFADGAVHLTAQRSLSVGERQITVQAHGRDPSGTERVLAEMPLTFADGDGMAEGDLTLPAELRGRLSRFEIAGMQGAGAVALTDDSLRRREIALVAATENREGLELLSPLHYLRQALSPTADLLEGGISEVLPANPDVIVLADVAAVPGPDEEAMLDWIDKGGLLLRFAGPRLAASEVSRRVEDPLMPVRLRAGGRMVGGAMSWGAPKSLAPFDKESPFFGLNVPEDVTVTAQVVAQPDPTLAERVIAALSDGTPLVTRKKIGQGQVILFHVSANAEWSSLPLSGLFVDMLERLAVSTNAATPDAEELAGTVWKPVKVLTGLGALEDGATLPGVTGEALAEGSLGPDLRPGLYATGERQIARNVLHVGDMLHPASWPAHITVGAFERPEEMPLGGWLLALALALLSLDIFATLALSGRLRQTGAGTAALLMVAFVATTPDTLRAEDARAIEATSELTLAHVITGDREIDDIAQAGLFGLSETLFFRTSVEPGTPMAINLETDELAFYPLLYWPIAPNQPRPSEAAYEKLNKYLRSGGMIMFDTRDGDIAGFGASSPNGRKLQQLAAPLEIPALEPVPSDHVLTRTFYLLQEFPGRYTSRDIWVEAAPPEAEKIEGMPFRNLNDNVTPVIIGGNDWAAAWAKDQRGQQMLPVGRGLAGERQRELAYRFGVNLVMYVLTGNYKSDQVHVPALLERLGQ